MRWLAASVVVTLLAIAAPTAQQPAGPATGLVVGRVVDATSNTPLRDVVVTIIGTSPQPATGRPHVYSVLSDTQGRFLFRELGKGTYQISATVSGNGYSPNGFIVSGVGFPFGAYLNGGFGQRRPDGPLQPIEVADGGRVDDAVIRLWKSAVITGRVLDEAGDPLVAHVVGVVRVASDGRWLNGPTMRTDDRGAYRFGSLAPGRYVVFVPETQVSMPAAVGDAIASSPADPLTARRYIAASAPSPALGGVRVGTSLVSNTQDRGNFAGADLAISNAVPPVSGLYRITAWRDGVVPTSSPLPAGSEPERVSDRAGAWASEAVSVGTRALENVTVTMRPAVSVTGRVEFAGSAPAPPVERVRTGFLTIWRTRTLGRAVGSSPGARVDPDAGNLIVVRRVSPPGRFFVGAPSFGAPWVVESMTIAGRDVTDAGFAVNDVDISDLVVTYTDKPGTVSGSVALSGVVADEMAICLFATDKTRWRDARLSTQTFRLVKPSATGAFSFSAVPPGEYFVAAVADTSAGDWPDTAFLERLARSATAVRLTRGQTTSLQLKAVDLR